jgi:hypothetical protein
MNKMLARTALITLAVSILPAAVYAERPPDPHRFSLEFESGAFGFSRNDVRIPGNTGTKFDMLDLTGEGPEAFFRLSGDWDITPRHGLRVVIAPLEVSGTGELSQPTTFAGELFAPGATKGSYKFSFYKLIYRYTFFDNNDWRWRVGFTGLIRDANIELQQGAKKANDDNVGFAPLLHLYGEHRFTPRWRFILDFDGLASPQGRAFDLALKVSYDVTRHWNIGAGYRTLEGGVDNDDVYNFAWLHYAVLSAGYRF